MVVGSLLLLGVVKGMQKEAKEEKALKTEYLVARSEGRAAYAKDAAEEFKDAAYAKDAAVEYADTAYATDAAAYTDGYEKDITTYVVKKEESDSDKKDYHIIYESHGYDPSGKWTEEGKGEGYREDEKGLVERNEIQI